VTSTEVIKDTHSNEPFVRGKIDFANHIRHNSYRKHIHALIYEHFTENILMNQIFKSVLLQLGQISRLRENRIRIGQALIWAGRHRNDHPDRYDLGSGCVHQIESSVSGAFSHGSYVLSECIDHFEQWRFPVAEFPCPAQPVI
jgi:hypothetical protein